MTSAYVLDPIAATVAQHYRAVGGVRYVADSKPGYPCRVCLRDAEIGDSLILLRHDPFDNRNDSAYRSTSPIFVHEEPCKSPEDLTVLPEQLTVRQLSVRAFGDDAMMVDSEVIDGEHLDGTLRRLFADDQTDYVHIHNASRGCWATTARRVKV